MVRLGASVEELAREAIESIKGFDGKGGHKPPRADIQKMKDAYHLWHRAQEKTTPEGLDDSDLNAEKEWAEKYGLNEKEQSAVALYKHVLNNGNGEYRNDPQKAFDFVARMWSSALPFTDPDAKDEQIPQESLLEEPTPEGKKFVGNALKKYEQQNYPMLYQAIVNMLEDAYRRGPHESYKLWPRMVNWLKDDYQNWLIERNNSFNRPNQSPTMLANVTSHILDVGLAGGKVLDQLRRENKLPQGFDVNKVNFQEFEEWFMDWKKENLGSEHAGEVVYQFHDGWTVQKLTTADQLQYEGDEMGHCVGGYSYATESGQTIIFSLRDKGGTPHATMEVNALEGAPSHGWHGGEEPEDAAFNHEYVHPDKHTPGEHMEDTGTAGRDGYWATGDTPFNVVQIMGKANQTPKPEYQHKIKEFLDSLRAKGWKFKRSEDWFAPFDERGHEYGEDSISEARELDDWYDEHYKTHFKSYQKGGEDAYGMNAERTQHSIGDWETLFQSCMNSLVEEYDRGKWTGDWQNLGQAVYHAWCLDTYKDELSEEQLERAKENLHSEITKAEETLHGWVHNQTDAYYQYNDGDEKQYEFFEEILKEQGLQEKFEAEVQKQLIAQHGEEAEEWAGGSTEETEIAEQLAQTPEWEDHWMEARDKVMYEVEDEYAGDAYKFCNYVYQLVEHNGVVNPADLPDPNQDHGGFPHYDHILEDNQNRWSQQKQVQDQTPTLDLSQGVQQGLPGAMSHWVESVKHPVEIHPIDEAHNVWFDTDGNQRARFRPGWAKNPTTGKMEQTGELEDSFLDKQGRQGQGWVAYNDDQPVGSLTYVDQDGWHMIGTAYTHPDYREQGIFNQLAAPLRATGQPVDAYVWENPWLKQKVRGWR